MSKTIFFQFYKMRNEKEDIAGEQTLGCKRIL